MGVLSKAISIIKKDGIFVLFKIGIPYAHNHHIAPRLPRTSAEYNGVEVKAARYFDSVLPWRAKDKPEYESGIVSGLKKHVKKGDRIVIVGGGWGVTAVKAAKESSPSGEVVVYEGSIHEFKYITDTIRRNDIRDQIEVIHGIVGPNISLRGRSGEASQIYPEKLPNCDVLELDCEGSEIDILENLTIRPRVIIVESHGMNGAPSSEIENVLGNMSYSIKSKEIADESMKQVCIKNDVQVLTAIKK